MKRPKKRKPMETSVEPEMMDEETLKLHRKLWGLRLPSPPKMKTYRTRKETFRLLKEGKLKLKGKPNRLVVSEYETEATEDAEKRENSKYIKDHIHKRKRPIKKRKIRKEYIFIKGHDSKGNVEFWKVRLKKKPKPKETPYEVPFIYKSILGNERHRQVEVIDLIRKLWNRRNSVDDWRPGMYDRMPDDLLLYFNENVRNEDGKKRRFTSFEFLEITPDKVSEMIKPFRSPIMSRLKKFEDERNERKRSKPMLEDEKQRYVRKLKADEAKTKYLQRIGAYLKTSLYNGVREIIEVEGKRYEFAMKEFQMLVNSASIIMIKDLDRYIETTLNNEIEDALNLRRETLEEEIMTTAVHKERELEYSYKHIFLPYELSKQKELFQLEMSSYVQYWTTKTRDIEKQVDLQKQYLKKQLETTKILQAAEHIPSMNKAFCDKVKEVQIKSKHKVEEALLPLKKKIEIYVNLQNENDQLLDSIRNHGTVISEFIRKLREFVNITQPTCNEKIKFMAALDELEKFKQQLQHNEIKESTEDSSTSVEYLSKTKSNIAIVEPIVTVEEEEESFFSMAHRILSDGDLDENAKYLLKMKFIISDLLKSIIPSGSVTEEDHTIEDIESFKQVNDLTSGDEMFVLKSTGKKESISVIDKLMEISAKLDFMLQIVGDTYSIPDLVRVGSYLNKRSHSVEKILEKHREMFENI
ncbi:unnamed protein product [Nezara viridula]|uniref:Uncharacterized protein n=1 Tax=Nezara viridula TaxID=85310 RepID=A0A9P0MIU4_NEZVI|nr:unnamed protein product [Nezara viridula]